MTFLLSYRIISIEQSLCFYKLFKSMGEDVVLDIPDEMVAVVESELDHLDFQYS